MTEPDRVALVTGAARGQGAAIVQRLRADGFKVAACDLAADELKASVAALGDAGVIAVPLDVTAEEQWASAVAEVLDTFGALSTLVNNAGVLHRAALSDETADGFERSWRVNTLGPFLGMRACLPALSEAEGASIVNTCSTGAVRPFPNHAAYGSSKWALAGPDPDRRRRTRVVRHSGQRGVARRRGDADAGREDAGPAGCDVGGRPDR